MRIPRIKSHTESRYKLNFVHKMELSLLRYKLNELQSLPLTVHLSP